MFLIHCSKLKNECSFFKTRIDCDIVERNLFKKKILKIESVNAIEIEFFLSFLKVFEKSKRYRYVFSFIFVIFSIVAFLKFNFLS